MSGSGVNKVNKKEWIVHGGQAKTAVDGKYAGGTSCLSSIIDRLLEVRGITSEEQKRDFLNPLEITLMHPNAFCEMSKAVDRIVKAIDEKENILISSLSFFQFFYSIIYRSSTICTRIRSNAIINF